MTKVKKGLNTVVYSDNPEAEVALEPKEKKNNVYNFQPTLPGIDEKPKEKIKSLKTADDIIKKYL